MSFVFIDIPRIQTSLMKFPEPPLLLDWFWFLLNQRVDFASSSQETCREKELWEEILQFTLKKKKKLVSVTDLFP